MRSNQWCVAPSRSADKVPILLADPHLTWEGLAVMYEARVHAGDLHMNGFFLVGSPILGIGHNQHVGWALTTGGPDTSDVYKMKFKLGSPPKYEYDGKWRKAKMKFIAVRHQGLPPFVRPRIYTHLGPVITRARPERRAKPTSGPLPISSRWACPKSSTGWRWLATSTASTTRSA